MPEEIIERAKSECLQGTGLEICEGWKEMLVVLVNILV